MMANKSVQVHKKKLEKASIRRKGIHAKSKMSMHKSSKHYVKLKVGQG
jgi:hypothetical protein